MNLRVASFFDDKRILPACVAILILIFFLPALIFGARESDDIGFHISWFTSFFSAVHGGTFYPRWLGDQMGGMGSPALFFYPPFTNYFFVLVDTLTLHQLASDRVLSLSAFLMSLASAGSFFVWARQTSARQTALLAAAFYAIAPYHVLIDYYTRGAFAEYATYIWIPLVFAGIRGSVHTDATRWPLLLAGSTGALFCTHLLTTMAVLPVAAIYALLLLLTQLPANRRTAKFLIIAAAVTLGAGCAAVYTVPAISLLGFVSSQALFVRPIESSFFYNALPIMDHFVLLLFAIATFYLALTLYLCIENRLAQRGEATTWHGGRGREGLLWAGIIVAIYLLMNGFGAVLLKAPSPYKNMQFAWRLLVLVEFGFFSMLVTTVTRSTGRGRVAGILLLAAVAALPFQVRNLYLRFAPQAWASHPLLDTDTYRARLSPPEYFPAGSAFPPEQIKQAAMLLAGYGNNMVPARILSGSGEIVSARRLGHEFFLSTRATAPIDVGLSQFYFPGWQARDETGALLEVAPAGPDRVLSLRVPAGTHTIEVTRGVTPQERAGWAISLACVLLLVALTVMLLRAKARGKTMRPLHQP